MFNIEAPNAPKRLRLTAIYARTSADPAIAAVAIVARVDGGVAAPRGTRGRRGTTGRGLQPRIGNDGGKTRQVPPFITSNAHQNSQTETRGVYLVHPHPNALSTRRTPARRMRGQLRSIVATEEPRVPDHARTMPPIPFKEETGCVKRPLPHRPLLSGLRIPVEWGSNNSTRELALPTDVGTINAVESPQSGRPITTIERSPRQPKSNN